LIGEFGDRKGGIRFEGATKYRIATKLTIGSDAQQRCCAQFHRAQSTSSEPSTVSVSAARMELARLIILNLEVFRCVEQVWS